MSGARECDAEAEGGALALLEKVLTAHGFICNRLRFSEQGTPDVENLYARIGTAAPNICFAGHTDVVPPETRQNGQFLLSLARSVRTVFTVGVALT